MKSKYIIPFVVILPLTGFAGNKIVGTDDGNTDTFGDLEGGSGYIFQVNEKKSGRGDFGMYGTSNVDGQWWVADQSEAPWEQFIANPSTGKQPSFHVSQDLVAGQEFFVGLSQQFEINNYVSSLRMDNANDIFTQDIDIYFGLRNSVNPGAINTVGEHVIKTEGLSTLIGTDGPVAPGADQFEWAHYTTDSLNGSGDIVFDIGGGNVSLTEWVVYFVLPDPMATVDNELWGAAPPVTNDDIVFSWTVHAKANNGAANPEWQTGFGTVPEPSSALMLLGGAGLFLCRRSRKAA